MAPPFRIGYSSEASGIIAALAKTDQRRAKKIGKAIRQLTEIGPTYPGLQSHRYDSLRGPNGEEVWESYVENKTPGAWRVFWTYGPGDGVITILDPSKHP